MNCRCPPLTDLTGGGFATVIDEAEDLAPAQVQRVVFCSGKVYFDLLKARRAASLRDVALVRIEQLYPFPTQAYEAVLRRYPQAREVVWCQEEPQNQGAWYSIRHRLEDALQPGQQTCCTPVADMRRRRPRASPRCMRPSSANSSMPPCGLPLAARRARYFAPAPKRCHVRRRKTPDITESSDGT